MVQSTISNSFIQNNQAYATAAIKLIFGDLKISDCVFRDNSAI